MTIEERVLVEGTPLIDEEGATFVWFGEQAPRLIGDWNDWGWEGGERVGQPLSEQAPGIWTFTLPLPADSYIEYGYLDGPWRLADPHNPRERWNGVEAFNHYFAMPGWQPSELLVRQRGVPAGRLSQHSVETGGLLPSATRSLFLYQPPTAAPVPLMVVFDGSDYLHRARLPLIVDNLIARGQMRPIALAMVESGGSARTVEYLNSDATGAFLVQSVLPLAARELRLVDIERQPGAFGLLGASMGGLISLYLGLRLPHLFGHIISQSGAFSLTLPSASNPIFDLLRQAEQRPRALWLDVGRFEWLRQSNEHLRARLARQGYAFAFRTYNGGHNYTCWANELAYALPTVWGT